MIIFKHSFSTKQEQCNDHHGGMKFCQNLYQSCKCCRCNRPVWLYACKQSDWCLKYKLSIISVRCHSQYTCPKLRYWYLNSYRPSLLGQVVEVNVHKAECAGALPHMFNDIIERMAYLIQITWVTFHLAKTWISDTDTDILQKSNVIKQI